MNTNSSQLLKRRIHFLQ